MSNISLKVSKSSYSAKVSVLQGLVNELDGKIQLFQRKRDEMDNFIGQHDSNYDNLVKNINSQVKSCEKAKSATLASIRMLQDTLKDMEEFSAGAKQVLEQGVELAETQLENAVEGLKAAGTIAVLVK